VNEPPLAPSSGSHDESVESANERKVEQPPVNTVPAGSSHPASGPTQTSTPTPLGKVGRIVVQVSGAVRNPGLFEVDDDTRVGEVIDLAGGTSIVAETAEINFARRVVDGEQIFIPKRVVGPRDVKPIAIPAVLDLNLASAEQLAALPGVGPDLGAAIVAHRRQVGKFSTVEQLLDVKGIGPRKLAGIRKRLRV